MGTKFKTIGHVELWRDDYTDAKLKPDTANALAKPKTVFQNQKEKSEYEAKYIFPLQRLTAAIRIAPIMAQVAVDRLTSLLPGRGSAEFLPESPEREKSLTNTVLALYKYFNIPYDLRERGQDHELWLKVEKICSLYERVLNGLRGPYRIYLFEPQIQGKTDTDGALGFVRHTRLAQGQSHPLETYFRNTPVDTEGHIPWPTWLVCSDIHLKMEALSRWADEGRVAALLLHEATHKWANTTDVCYKFQSLAYKLKHTEWEKAEGERKTERAKDLTRRIKDGLQPQLIRADKAKPLLPLAKQGITVEQWVYNADSYACMARRLWKEETTKGTQAYAAWDD